MHIGISYPENEYEAPVAEFLTDLDNAGIIHDARKTPPMGPMATLEAYIPTAVILWVAANYFSPMIREAGKSHYQSLAKAVGKLFGGISDVTVRRVSTQGKIDKTYPFSLLLSLEAEGNKDIRFKLLLPIGASPSDISKAVVVFVSFLERFHTDTLNATEKSAIGSVRIVGSQIIIVSDIQNECVTFPDPLVGV